MKKRIKIILLVFAITAYLAAVMVHAHKEWKNGITMEEHTREDLLIW